MRARMVLLAAEGLRNDQIAARLNRRREVVSPRQHRSWIFPRDPLFVDRAGPILDLVAPLEG